MEYEGRKVIRIGYPHVGDRYVDESGQIKKASQATAHVVPVVEATGQEWLWDSGLKEGDVVEIDCSSEDAPASLRDHEEGFFGEISGSSKRRNTVCIKQLGAFWNVPFTCIRKAKAPGYRPFKDADEFWVSRDRWLKRVVDGLMHRPSEIAEGGIVVCGELFSWKELLSGFVFTDTGKPCGVPK